MDGRFGQDLDWMAELSTSTGATVLYILQEADWAPEQWRDLVAIADEHNRRGARLVRPVLVIVSLVLTARLLFVGEASALARLLGWMP